MVKSEISPPDLSRVLVRAARMGDIPVMADLLAELFALETDFTISRPKQSAALHLLLTQPDTSCVMVACTPAAVIGMCTAQLVVSTAEGGLAARVEDLIVARSYRRMGVATTLLSTVAQWAAQHGSTRLQLLADKHNTPALQFYQKRGWQTTQLICLQHHLNR